MKVALIVYHSNLLQYPPEWIEQFRQSILNQTIKGFTIIELNYGGGQERIFEDQYFQSHKLSNHAEAMNMLLIACFDKWGVDYVLNTNCDDWYSPDRVEKQLECLEQGYDIVSSNFSLHNGTEFYHTHQFHALDIKSELDKDHNIICHPVVAYSKNFWDNNCYYDEEIPFEDLRLWQRTIDNYKFKILPDVLCYHRVHKTSVGHQ